MLEDYFKNRSGGLIGVLLIPIVPIIFIISFFAWLFEDAINNPKCFFFGHRYIEDEFNTNGTPRVLHRQWTCTDCKYTKRQNY